MGQLRNVPEDAHSISSNQITCLFLDDSDHLWAGHSTYGVSHADLTPSLFRYTLGYTEKENLSSLHILAVYEDSDLNLWVATSRGLDRINHKTSRVFIVAFLIILSVTIGTVTFRNWQAANENPVNSVKSE